MEENLATNDVAVDAQIADLSARTATAFTQYSRVFLWWGAIALADFVIQFLYKHIRQMITDQSMHNSDAVVSNFQAFQTSALIGFIWLAVILAGWYLVYHFMARTVNPSGMSKELMKLWGWSIVITLLPVISSLIHIALYSINRGYIDPALAPSLYFIGLLPLPWFVFALMMMVTATITRTKMYIWFALLFALIGVIVPSGIFAYPITFFILGGYLEWKRRENAIDLHDTENSDMLKS